MPNTGAHVISVMLFIILQLFFLLPQLLLVVTTTELENDGSITHKSVSIKHRLQAAEATNEGEAMGKSLNHVYDAAVELDSPLTFDNRHNPGSYLMKLKLGTPPVTFKAFLLLGSLTWVKCKYDNGLPSFDPTKSSTYKTISCGSPTCQALDLLQFNSTCKKIGDTCHFEDHGSKDFSGTFASETLTMKTSNRATFEISNFMFGCADRFDAATDYRAIVGFGRSNISLPWQLGGKFSYCLVPFSSTKNLESPMRFGTPDKLAGEGWQTTPLVSNPVSELSELYYLNLEAINLGGKKIDMPRPDNLTFNGTIIIDISNPGTLVPSAVFHQLKGIFLQELPPAHGSKASLEACANVSGHENHTFPPLTFHLENADWVIAEQNYLLRIAPDIVCLNLSPTDAAAQIGFTYQHNFEFFFDLINSQVSFRPQDCGTATSLSSP